MAVIKFPAHLKNPDSVVSFPPTSEGKGTARQELWLKEVTTRRFLIKKRNKKGLKRGFEWKQDEFIFAMAEIEELLWKSEFTPYSFYVGEENRDKLKKNQVEPKSTLWVYYAR